MGLLNPGGARAPGAAPPPFFVSQTLAHEHVGFDKVGDGVWDLNFFNRLLARLNERTWKLMG